MKIFLVVLVLVCLSTCNAVVWQEGSWAWNCDFPYLPSVNLYSVPAWAEGCYQQCKVLVGCTHFVWKNSNGVGTCFFKTGVVTQGNAVDAWLLPEFRWFGSICGIPPK